MSKQEWSYEGETGPHNWHLMFPCASGHHQTPIDILTEKALFDQKLATVPLKFTYNENCFKSVENTGSGFNVSGLANSVSSVKGGPVEHEHKFLQFHFHWGKTDNEGSEHLVNGKSYAAELHIVNWNSQLYESPAEAVKSNNHDGLIVLGIFLQAGKHNNELDKILTSLNEISLKGQKTNLKEKLNLRNLFPNFSNYWSYKGSLTTPPCSECVTWVVFQEPIEVSSEQLNSFRELYSCSNLKECNENTRINFNFRPVCPLNDRIIKKSF
jgi:carbonic anhydrase